jgi:iron complex outermembrane receptor protein
MANFKGGDGSARGGHGIGICGKRTTFPRATLAAFLTSASLGVVSLTMPAEAQVRAESVSFDIPSQPINEALLAFARQAGVRLVMPDAQFGDARSNAVRGAYDRETALAELLRGTGVAARLENGAIVLQRTAEASSATQLAAFNEADDDKDKVVIVGTNIRGVYPSSSPVETYTAVDIARTGATTTEQFIRKLPQNSGTRAGYAAGTGNLAATKNNDSVNGVDLRGLGVGTTLTLVNGRRIGLSDFGQTADVSLIPVAAIERVEVLTDGASAIYGSDAIGGVVNFVLRDDFDGAETNLSYGGVTDGSLRQGDFSQVIGGNWTGGRAIAGYAYHSASALERNDRDYAAPAGRGDLTPDEIRQNVFLGLSQNLTDRLTFESNAAFATRNIKNQYTTLSLINPLNHTFQDYHSETEQWFANAALVYQLTSTFNASLQASYVQERVDRRAVETQFNRTPPIITPRNSESEHSGLDITAKLDGTLFALAGGAVRFSAGAGLLDEDYGGQSASGFLVGRDLGRRTTYAFAEVFAPIIGDDQSIPFVQRLELSLAGRYTSYDDTSSPSIDQDFGDSMDPKVGLLWSPCEGLNLRGTYGTSFRAPALTQLDPTGAQITLASLAVAGVASNVLIASQFPAGILQPETAETFTLGFDFRPTARPSFRLSGTYYSISYEDRIGSAPGISCFANPQNCPERLYRPTSVAQLLEIFGQATLPTVAGVNPADRNAVATALFARPNLWISDFRSRNLALSEQDGFDLSISDDFQTPVGDLSLGVTMTRILAYRERLSASSMLVSRVDTVSDPTDLRGRAFATMSRGGFSGTLSVNYTDDYINSTGGGIDEWVTTDLALAYAFGDGGVLGGMRLNLSVQNAFDEDPPFVTDPSFSSRVGFDSTNANPLGRLVVFSVSKTW